MDTKVSVAGRYRLKVSKEDGTLVKDTGWFDNLILDQGLDQIGLVDNYNEAFGEPVLFRWGSVGTGSTPPTVIDTQMESFLASASNNDNYITSKIVGPPFYWKCVSTYRFGAGAAAGNLTEVGVGERLATNTGTNLFSRALILDGDGNPTTLTVASDEILDMTYEFRVYPDTTTNVQVLSINGVDYTFTWNVNTGASIPPIHHAYINSTGTFSSLGYGFAQNSSGGGATASKIPSSAGYSAGTYQRTYVGTFGTGEANAAYTYFFLTSPHNRMIASISPAIDKTSAQQMTITSHVSWIRYTP